MAPPARATRSDGYRILFIVAAWLAASGAPASAQTTDPLFAGFRFAPPALGSRPAGMGGAFTGMADGVKAAYANPAGLSLVPIREVGLSSGEAWLGGALRWGRLRLAGYGAKLAESRLALPDVSPSLAGSLESSVREAGLAASLELHPRLRLGGSLAWSELRLVGERIAAGAGGEPAASVAADDSQARASFGLLLLIVGTRERSLPGLRLGVSVQPGFDWSASIATEGQPAAIELRRPTLVSTGLAWRASDRFTVVAQGDVIRYSEVVDTLERNVGPAQASGFAMSNVVEPRVGAEYWAPLACGCGLVRLRAGLHYRSPGTLRYEGADPLAALSFGADSWRTVATLGGSFVAEYFGHALRLDLDSSDLVEGPALSFGIAWRF